MDNYASSKFSSSDFARTRNYMEVSSPACTRGIRQARDRSHCYISSREHDQDDDVKRVLRRAVLCRSKSFEELCKKGVRNDQRSRYHRRHRRPRHKRVPQNRSRKPSKCLDTVPCPLQVEYFVCCGKGRIKKSKFARLKPRPSINSQTKIMSIISFARVTCSQ